MAGTTQHLNIVDTENLNLDNNSSDKEELDMDKMVNEITEDIDTLFLEYNEETDTLPSVNISRQVENISGKVEHNPRSVEKRVKKNRDRKKVLPDESPNILSDRLPEILPDIEKKTETTPEKISTKHPLSYTRACRLVTEGIDENGNFGVCYRATCTFAHSLEEFQPPICKFGSTCRFLKLSKDSDPKNVCKFKHSSETLKKWIKRAGIDLKLPETSEMSHRPCESKPASSPDEEPENMYSKPCQYVTDTDKGGVCYREGCTFAHSIDQLKPRQCQHGEECKLFNGRVDPVTKKVLNTKCSYSHPKESFSDWLDRTGFAMSLPQTSEFSHQPLSKEEFEKMEEAKKAEKEPKKERLLKKEIFKKEKVLKSEAKFGSKVESKVEIKKENTKSKSFDAGEKLVIEVPSEEAKKEAFLSAMRAGIFNIDIIVKK